MDVTDVAMALGALPLLAMLVLLDRDRKRARGFWWIAAAFYVSFLSDAATALSSWSVQWIPVAVYPASQAALIGMALLESTRAAVGYNAALVAVGVLASVLQPPGRPDAILTPLAWLSVSVMAWKFYWVPLDVRFALVVYFGLGAFAWWAFVKWQMDPLYRPWYAVQATRLGGIALFCRAVWTASPRLKLVR